MSRNAFLALLAVVALILVGVLLARQKGVMPGSGDGAAIAIDGFDPANEGKLVSIHGTLVVSDPPRDTQLSLVADGQAVLMREVQMYQWQEICEVGACRYEGIWASQRIDSTPFQTHTGHSNPEFPFASESLIGDGMRVADLDIAPGLVVAAVEPVDYSIEAGRLPPNLAATFEARDGDLYTGVANDPKIGDLRIHYRSIPAGAINLTAIQHGSRLELPPKKEG